MKSYVVYDNGVCGIVNDMPMPHYGEYDALVKIESCGVCNGTDTKIIHRQFKGIDTYPVVLGHEGVGRVVAKGQKVTNFEIGDLVLMPYWSDVPEGYTSGWGTYSEYNIVTDALAMGAIAKNYSASDTALLAFKAGCDILLDPGNLPEAYAAILGAVSSGEISMERLDESVLRILRAKSKLTEGSVIRW